MRKPDHPKVDVLETVIAVHTATTAILVALTKTLEEAGVMKAEHFEANVRMTAARMAARSEGAGLLIEDFADQLQRPGMEGKA